MTDDVTEESAAVAVAEDVEDLKAEVRRLSAQVAALVEEREGASAADADQAAEPEQEEKQEEAAAEEEESPPYPPFIHLLEGEAYHEALRGLIEWVEGVLVPGYLGEASADARWCPRWMEHEPAIGHLHALWLAWQEHTDPHVCGYSGPSTWHRDHYRPAMTELRGPTGPFAGCTKTEHTAVHRLPGQVPSIWYVDDASGR